MNNLITNSAKRAIRATQILQCKKECDERGITVSQWCREHNLSEKSYWYYHKKLGDTLYEVARTEGMIDTAPQIDTPTFVEVPQFPAANGSCKASLRIGSMTIEIDESISDYFLQRLMKAGSNV
ncbi:MAG: hypothetical protein J6D38_08975 [Solobacterium sp.]|nr:hypothetical protein [Solobacterium sp.]